MKAEIITWSDAPLLLKQFHYTCNTLTESTCLNKGLTTFIYTLRVTFTCYIFFDLMNFADGVVASEHVEVEGLGVFTNPRPCTNVRSGPPS